jgi:pyruvate kinase
MLAAETAVGAYPARTVQILDAIIREAEASPEFHVHTNLANRAASGGHAEALCEAAVTLADRANAQAIVAVTRGGATARRLSALRPRAPIIAVTESRQTARRLALQWGVVPFVMEIGDNLDEASPRIAAALVERGLVTSGAPAVVVSINADLRQSDANYLKIRRA